MSTLPRVFGGHFRVVPTYILEQIDKLLDEQIALVPEAEADREHLKDQLLDHVDQYGVVPDFKIVPNEVTENE